MQEIIKNISHLSSSLGFVDFGIARAEELIEEVEHYKSSIECGYFADMGYLSRNIEKRFNPQLLVEGAKSILVFLAPYGYIYNNTPNVNTALSGVASYAHGEDYHTIIKNKLHIILNSIPIKATGRVFTDSAPILERAWAVKAGLGFIGKNNFFISRKVGIKTLIGIIITDIELPVKENTNNKKYCGSCTKCIDACPTGALCAPYKLDARKCISYNTIERKNLWRVVVEGKEALPALHGQYFGCDACLDACPWNRKNAPGWGEFLTNRNLLCTATEKWWENLSEEEFEILFATSPLLRTGLENIKASLLINKNL